MCLESYGFGVNRVCDLGENENHQVKEETKEEALDDGCIVNL